MGADETSTQKSDSYYIEDPNDVSEFYKLDKLSNIENSLYKEEELTLTNITKELNKKTSESQGTIPTTFEWDNGGNSVYVTGSFCNWSQFFLMKKDSDKNFFLTLNLPKGYHQYKFKVDGEWKFNHKFPTVNDNGNINNYLDTKNFEITVKNSDEGTTAFSTSITDNFNELFKTSKKHSKNIFTENSEIIIGQSQDKIQTQEPIFDKIDSVPLHYKYSMDINLLSNQNKIGSKNFMKIKEKNILSDNLSFKKINVTPAEQINHLNLKKDSNKSESIICAATSRYRYKTTTFVYYKPKK